VSPTELAGFGVQFVVSVLLFLYLGRWLDGKLGSSPLLLILGAFVGAGAAFYSLYRKLAGRGGRRS
jgi:F0F1-type ATP synthase assembly protein I